MKTHYIYTLTDDAGTIFYVGKTVNPHRRLQRHWYQVRKGSNLYVHNKMRHLQQNGIDTKIVVIEKDVDEKDVDDRETFHIQSFKNQGVHLCNLTSGGEGGKGMSPEMQKAAAAKRVGQKRSRETCRRISEARKGMKFSETHLKNLSAARKKRIITTATRIKCSQTSKGKINIKKFRIISPEGKEYITNQGLVSFCEQNNFKHDFMRTVTDKNGVPHKGWIGFRLDL